jgi:DNA-3-methyladenine glycosylase
MTPRNEVMFREGGHLYVYFTYGMHFCCNVVTGPPGKGLAVLLRAVQPIVGIDVMRDLRSAGGKRPFTESQLCSGPGKLCQAFGIGRAENGTDLCGDTIWIAGRKRGTPAPAIARSTRIGITSGREHPWRFYLKESPFVSRGTPAGRRRKGR